MAEVKGDHPNEAILDSYVVVEGFGPNKSAAVRRG